MDVSVIIPCYNSSPILRTLIQKTCEELEKLGFKEYEFILVNDCSPNPDTITFLKELVSENQSVKLIDLAKNTGQANAQVAALNYASGKFIINMDDDMQTHPSNIPILYNKLCEGYDLVLGKYKKKKHALHRNLLTKMDDVFEETFLNKPKKMSFTSFWITRDYIVKEIVKFKLPYAFMEGLFLRTAGKIANVEIEHFDRQIGASGYNLKKLVKLWSNFTGFTILPLRLSALFGILTAICGFIWSIILIVQKFLIGTSVEGYASIMCVLLVFFGIVLICLGLIGEYIGRIFMSVNSTPQYVVKDVYNIKEEK